MDVKLNKEQNMDGVRTVIDDLPDMILQHILSFLPTTDAVQTTILSKSLKGQWMFISNFDFKERAPDKRMFFMNFVETVVLLRNPSNINKFSLQCDVLSDESRINAWIYIALGHIVQELHVCLKSSQGPFVLPLILFMCDSLTVMELIMDCYLKLPSYISFSSFKKLTLMAVVFPDGDLTQKLFSGCPVLEELSPCYCSRENVKAVCISAPMLRKLKITDEKFGPDGDTDDENNVNDVKDPNYCQIVICGTNLGSFSLSGELRHDYCFINTSSLVEASLVVEGSQCQYLSDMEGKEAHCAYKLLRGFSDVEILELAPYIVEVLTYTKELLAHLPVFSNLTCLRIHIRPIDLTCGALLNILQNSPCLDTLEFSSGIELDKCGGTEWNLDPVPPCFLTNLSAITVGCFTGMEMELCAIKILLKNATVLERFIIECYFLDQIGNEEKVKGVKEQILLFPKGSISCEIELW